jgi:putative transposase
MPTPVRYKAPFYAGSHYHIIFRSIDGLKLFEVEENHHLFLQRFSRYMFCICDCLAYCLLNNHVHFIIQIKPQDILIRSISAIQKDERTVSMNRFLIEPETENNTDILIERQVNSFMVAYTNAYNLSYIRKGSLFQSPFRRTEIKEESHLQQAIIYTHANAQKHGIIKDYKAYKYSSYWEIVQANSVYVNVSKVLAFFGGRDKFIDLHQIQIDHFYNKGWPVSKLGD